MSSTCYCCQEPPCPAPILEFISVSGECVTCGHATYDFTGSTAEDLAKCWKTETRVFTKYLVNSYTFAGTDRTDTTNISLSRTTEIIPDGDACVENFVEGNYSYLFTQLWLDSETDEAVVDDVLEIVTTAGPDGVYSGTETYTDNLYAPNNTSGSSTEDGGIVTWPVSLSWTYSAGSYTLVTGSGSDVTTKVVSLSDLVTPCVPEFPAWPEWERDRTEESPELEAGQGYNPTASRSDAACGFTRYDEKIQWRLVHLPTGTCYMKAWVYVTFVPEGGLPEAPTITEYEWNGTGNPCLPVPNGVSADDDDQLTIVAGAEVGVPALAGTTYVTLKYSCVDGYEPDITDPDNMQPNGYPDPAWEAAAP